MPEAHGDSVSLEKMSCGHVLVIDDEKMVADLVGELLREFGHRVTICNSGQQGIEYFRKAFKEVSDEIFVLIQIPKEGEFDRDQSARGSFPCKASASSRPHN